MKKNTILNQLDPMLYFLEFFKSKALVRWNAFNCKFERFG